jgi:hypothetical protein
MFVVERRGERSGKATNFFGSVESTTTTTTTPKSSLPTTTKPSTLLLFHPFTKPPALTSREEGEQKESQAHIYIASGQRSKNSSQPITK